MVNYQPFNSFYLEIQHPHKIYIEEYGNPNGTPFLYLHGGPGAGTSPKAARFFDLTYFRVVLIDQRGSGKSTPLGCLENNSIEHLTKDIEEIRKHLSIESWHVFGGSWGSTLALYYAITNPLRVQSLTLRGICLLEDYDIDWWLKGNKYLFPDLYDVFTKDIKTDNLLDFYYDKLCRTSQINKWHYQWLLYELSMLNFNPQKRLDKFKTYQKKPELIYSCSKIMVHYFKHCRPKILENSNVLNNIPIYAIHGRFDVVCPTINAHLLKKAVPNIDLVIEETSGHGDDEPKIEKSLKEAVNRVKIYGCPTQL